MALIGAAAATILVLSRQHDAMMLERQGGTRQVVEAAHGVVEYFGKLEREGKLPRGQAQAQALAALKGLRCSGKDEIVGTVKRVNAIIGEISSATREQSTGIAQVNESVSQLDGMNQQNAALVEQSAAAAESLKHQADRLARSVSAFKLERA